MNKLQKTEYYNSTFVFKLHIYNYIYMYILKKNLDEIQ